MLCLLNIYKFYLDMIGYLHHGVWKLIKPTWAAWIVMHSFGVGKLLYPWGRLRVSRGVVTVLKQLTKSLNHREVRQASQYGID